MISMMIDTSIEHYIHISSVDDTTSWWLVRVYGGGAELVAVGDLNLDLEEAAEELESLARTSWRRHGLVWVDDHGDDDDDDEDMVVDPVDR